MIAEWSRRWGSKVAGWWLDGCYFRKAMYEHDDRPNWASFAAAARAGNDRSILAFNPGVYTPVITVTEHEDYTAGEISTAFPVCGGASVDHAQYHVLSYLGETWGGGKPRLNDEFVVGYSKHITSNGGVISWDVPVMAGGQIPQPFLKQLAALE